MWPLPTRRSAMRRGHVEVLHITTSFLDTPDVVCCSKRSVLWLLLQQSSILDEQVDRGILRSLYGAQDGSHLETDSLRYRGCLAVPLAWGREANMPAQSAVSASQSLLAKSRRISRSVSRMGICRTPVSRSGGQDTRRSAPLYQRRVNAR